MSNELMLKKKYGALTPSFLDERPLRLCMAADAIALGYGGISCVAEAADASRTAVHNGICELKNQLKSAADDPAEPSGLRKKGGGRKLKKKQDETLLHDPDLLPDPITRGDPMNPLRRTCKSTADLSEELCLKGHDVSQAAVWRLPDELGYSMQSDRKRREGTDHPDRNAQFEFINSCVKDFLNRGSPVISADTKKKELIGEFGNNGKERQKRGEPAEVDMHGFPDKEPGKVIPYGVYDIGRNEGWVSVGVTHDTSEFAAETIRRWRYHMGKQVYPEAEEMLITADGGGSNGAGVRLRKAELQRLANELEMTIHVRHFPPGTGKRNKIEHRMFCHITENWRGRPLTTRMTAVNLISSTRTGKGLTIKANPDENMYETGRTVSEEEMKSLAISRCDFHGEWNYSLSAVKVNKK